MTTPLIMLFLLVAPCIAAVSLPSTFMQRTNLHDAAAIGLALLFIFTAVGHFIQTEPMSQMLPPWVPERILIVQLTGILEFAIAAGFVVRRTRRLTGIIAAAILVLFFPLNVYAAINHIPMGGHAWGPAYLFIRTPLQIIILLWVYWFTIRRTSIASKNKLPTAARPTEIAKGLS